jgi:terminase small subunit-like protein
MMDEIMEIADDSSQDTLIAPDGRAYANVEWIARCRLRIGARKWLMSKLALKKYRRP